MIDRLLLNLLCAVLVMAVGCAHPPRRPASGSPPEVNMIESCLAPADLARRVVRYAPVRIPFDPKPFSDRQLEAIEALVEASRIIDDLFWRQASPSGPLLRQRLASPRDEGERQLARYLAINYGAYDRLDGFEPFLRATDPAGRDLVGARPEGATFYPLDMTREEFEAHLARRPEDREAFQSCFTVIRRRAGGLVAVGYSEEYRPELERVAGLLRKAADNVSSPSLARYLRSRAQAFTSDDYLQSDLDWMDVADSPLEVTIGPYEVYEDRLFNFKAAFESFVTVRDPVESDKLTRLAGMLEDLERNLPIPDEHKNFERGAASPIAVVDLIYSAGDTRAGVQTLAFNLPNDERVREQKGSKKVLLKNISHAKFDRILAPIARRVLVEDQLARLSFDAYFNHTLMHEISHGLGPGFLERDGARVPVNQLLRETYSTIEEAKADVLGLYNTLALAGRGELEAGLTETAPVTFLAGVFRSVRFGAHEAHGQANAIAFNYLWEKGAYAHDPASGRFRVEPERVGPAVRELAHELLMIEALGDRGAALALIERHTRIRPEMQALLDSLLDVPVDIVPEFEVE